MFLLLPGSYQFVQSEAQAAVFIQDEEAPLPFLTRRHSRQNQRGHLLLTTESHVRVSAGRTLDRCIGLSKSVPSGAKHSQPPYTGFACRSRGKLSG